MPRIRKSAKYRLRNYPAVTKVIIDAVNANTSLGPRTFGRYYNKDNKQWMQASWSNTGSFFTDDPSMISLLDLIEVKK